MYVCEAAGGNKKNSMKYFCLKLFGPGPDLEEDGMVEGKTGFEFEERKGVHINERLDLFTFRFSISHSAVQ